MPPTTGGVGLWAGVVLRSLGAVIAGLAVIRLILVLFEPFGRRFLANDLNGYVEGARRFIAVGTPYLPEQLSGAWQLQPDSFIHPPIAVLLFLPFIVLPAVLWWAIPIGLTAWSVLRLRPAPWSWPVMAACLLWPRTAGILIAGNTDMWVAGAAGVALASGVPTSVLIVMKPSYVPLALLGANRREWWFAAAAVAVVCLLFSPLWLQYVTVLGGVTLEPLYSLYNAPYVAVPLVAWLASPRRPALRRWITGQHRGPTTSDPSLTPTIGRGT